MNFILSKNMSTYNDEGNHHWTYINFGLKVNVNTGLYTHGKAYNQERSALVIKKYVDLVVVYFEHVVPA